MHAAALSNAIKAPPTRSAYSAGFFCLSRAIDREPIKGPAGTAKTTDQTMHKAATYSLQQHQQHVSLHQLKSLSNTYQTSLSFLSTSG